jgi:ACS family hexuronate transporter-like MFS transporter
MICKEMNLSDEQYGELLAAFRWAYALTHLLAGFLADRFPLRVTYSLAVLVWSAAGAAASFARQFTQLLWTRRVLGFGEAFNWPCATRIVANLLPPQDRGLASGIFNSGSAAGSLAAPFIILPLAQWLGWRSAFFIIGSLGLVWIALWLFITRRGTPASIAIRPTPSAMTVRWIARPGFWMLLLVGVSVNPCWYFLNDWIPKYMHDQRGMSQLTAGMISAPIFLAADFGNLAGGGLVKFLASRGWTLRRARGMTVTLAVLLILPVALITRVSSATAVVTMLGCAAFGITAILANYTACQADFSFANVGAVAGVLGMACNVFAATVNPWVGRYVDATGTYNLIFVLIGVLPLVALAAILTFDALVWRTHDRVTTGPV